MNRTDTRKIIPMPANGTSRQSRTAVKERALIDRRGQTKARRIDEDHNHIQRMNTGSNRRIRFAFLLAIELCWASFTLFAADREVRLSKSPDRLFDTPFYLSVPTSS